MAIRLENISKSFNGNPVLDGLKLSFEDGQIHTILGPSGCGKTTLLNIINGTLHADEGLCNLEAHTISQVFQDPSLLPWKTVRENINYVLNNSDDGHSQEIDALIEDVGLTGSADKYPHELSGGMQQRCAIARAFAFDASTVILDEPFKGLDQKIKTQMINLVMRLWKKNQKTIVFVTHDVGEALRMSHSITLLSDAPTKVIFQKEISQGFEERSNSPEINALKEELNVLINA